MYTLNYDRMDNYFIRLNRVKVAFAIRLFGFLLHIHTPSLPVLEYPCFQPPLLYQSIPQETPARQWLGWKKKLNHSGMFL